LNNSIDGSEILDLVDKMIGAVNHSVDATVDDTAGLTAALQGMRLKRLTKQHDCFACKSRSSDEFLPFFSSLLTALSMSLHRHTL
jgi:hypothetical protein